MPSAGFPEPTAGDELQFDHAEFTAVAPGPVVCTSCARSIADAYYEAGGRVLCEPCVRGIDAHFRGGSRGLRFLKAVAFGFAAAIGAAIIIFLFRKLTGLEAGLISILAGYMVGSAVRQGSEYRGGRAYQFLALFLTYSALSWSCLPYVVEVLQNAGNPAAAAQGENPAIKVGPEARPGGQGIKNGRNIPAAKQDQANPAPEKVAEGMVELPKSVLLVILYGLALAAVVMAVAYCFPVLMIVSNLPQSVISLLIFFWGLQQAWQLTRKATIDFRGPFRVGGDGPSRPGVSAHA